MTSVTFSAAAVSWSSAAGLLEAHPVRTPTDNARLNPTAAERRIRDDPRVNLDVEGEYFVLPIKNSFVFL
jgi:hypothetical protein